MKRQLGRTAYFRLGRVPIGIGAVLKGWDLTEQQFRDPEHLSVVDCRIMTAACTHDCRHCYTDKQASTLTFEQQKMVIDQIADMGARGIDFLGEGEPTLDRHFLEVIEYTVARGVQPVVFTDGATRLRDLGLVGRLNELGATIIPKCDSLFDADYQNWVVRDETGRYFEQRNEVIEILAGAGFNAVDEDGTTRLGFDMVVTKRNKDQVEATIRYCRDRNMWVVFCPYLPAGRCVADDFDHSLVLDNEDRRQINETIRRVDAKYGFDHPVCANFGTALCVERVQIYGDGRVSPCPGNETIVGNILETPLRALHQRILELFPVHNPATFDGDCPYRPPVG